MRLWIEELEDALSSGQTEIYIVETRSAFVCDSWAVSAVFSTRDEAKEHGDLRNNPQGVSSYFPSGNLRHAVFSRVVKTRSKKRIHQEIRRMYEVAEGARAYALTQ